MSLSLNFCAALLKRNPRSNFAFGQKCMLSSSSTQQTKKNATTFLSKLMGKSQKKRRPWAPEVTTSSPLGVATKRTVGKQHAQRLKVLNNVFMQHISDFLSSSDLASNIDNFNLEISEVKISVDLNFITVFWCSSNLEARDTIQERLESIAFPLRHELSQLSVLGSIPRIVFTRDKKGDIQNEIDSLLRKADYGVDFTPTNPTLFHGIELPVSEEGQKIEDGTEKVSTEIAETRLQAQQKEVDELMALRKRTVFNLDQESIMNKIKISLEKSKAPHRKNVIYGEIVMDPLPEDNLSAVTERIEAIKSTELKDFLNERKKAVLKDQHLLEREQKKSVHDKISEEELDDRIRKDFADDGSNYGFIDSSEQNRDSVDDFRDSNDYFRDSKNEYR